VDPKTPAGAAALRLPEVRNRLSRAEFIAMKLSTRGFGTVEEILRTRADRVVKMWAFHNFSIDYEATITALNRREIPK
jgi:hypothetical protein